jgi:signal transduction histidine kinase
VATDKGIVWGDARFTKEILDNLLGNAIKFSEPGTTVALRLKKSKGRMAILFLSPGVSGSC